MLHFKEEYVICCLGRQLKFLIELSQVSNEVTGIDSTRYAYISRISYIYSFIFFSLLGLLVERPSVEVGHPLADKCREFTRQTGINVEAVTPTLTGGWD